MRPSHLLSIVSLLIAMIFSSCGAKAYDLEKNIGLYEVIETECNAPDDPFNSCQDIKYIELVKGRFFGVQSDQLALVFWRSESDSSKLQYSANLISNHRDMHREDSKIWLVNQTGPNETEKEFFIVTADTLTDYVFQSQARNAAGQVVLRDIYFKLVPTSRKETHGLKLDYPED